MALANLIRRYRFEHGEMTQKQLADLIGVSRQTVNAIERTKYPPSLEVAFRIAHAFGASIEDVFFYEPDIEGEHAFADGVVVDVSWDGNKGGGTENDGD